MLSFKLMDKDTVRERGWEQEIIAPGGRVQTSMEEVVEVGMVISEVLGLIMTTLGILMVLYYNPQTQGAEEVEGSMRGQAGQVEERLKLLLLLSSIMAKSALTALMVAQAPVVVLEEVSGLKRGRWRVMEFSKPTEAQAEVPKLVGEQEDALLSITISMMVSSLIVIIFRLGADQVIKMVVQVRPISAMLTHLPPLSKLAHYLSRPMASLVVL